jgi:translocation and assembly module TamA
MWPASGAEQMHCRLFLIPLFLFLVWIRVGEAASRDEEGVTKPPVPFTVILAGDLPAGISQFLKTQTPLLTSAPQTVRHGAALKRRLHEALPALHDLLAQKGFFDARITYAVIKGKARAGRITPLEATLHVQSGPRCVLSTFSTGSPLPPEISFDGSAVLTGQPLDWVALETAQGTLSERLRENGYIFHRWDQAVLTVDHQNATVQVLWPLHAGTAVHFGPSRITGLKNVRSDWILNRLPWKPGALWDDRLARRARTDLERTGLFSSVSVRPADPSLLRHNTIPVNLAVTEQPHKYAGFGVRYARQSRLGGKVFWGHRNLAGRGEHLEISLTHSATERLARIHLDKPDSSIPGQSVSAGVVWGYDTMPAWTRHSQEVSATFYRKKEHSAWFWGGTATLARLTTDQERSVTSCGLPFGWQTSWADNDNPDPFETDLALRLALAPWVCWSKPERASSPDAAKKKVLMLDQRLRASAALPLVQGQITLAGWGEFGLLYGPRFHDIPADRRYYAGGAGSVRGYSVQMAEPLAGPGARPQGGKTILQWGGECRFRWSENVTVVTFAEAALLQRDTTSRVLASRPFYGYGAGVRYRSGLGLFRFDLAFPGKKRSPDRAFEFYAGLGQAF